MGHDGGPQNGLFNFDAWAELARRDPAAFERQRDCYVNAVIHRASNCQRMRQLQFRIDRERIRSRTSLQACLRLSALMWDSYCDLRDVVVPLAKNTRAPITIPPPLTGNVLPFRKPGQHGT